MLNKSVAYKISRGATRNLLFQPISKNITEQRIRDDLEHIHNLRIVDIHFDRDSARVSLNSVNQSLYAQSCLRSRKSYHGVRIEWYPDDCADPLPDLTPRPRMAQLRASAISPVPRLTNRYRLLHVDDTEDGSLAEEETTDEESF